MELSYNPTGNFAVSLWYHYSKSSLVIFHIPEINQYYLNASMMPSIKPPDL